MVYAATAGILCGLLSPRVHLIIHFSICMALRNREGPFQSDVLMLSQLLYAVRSDQIRTQ